MTTITLELPDDLAEQVQSLSSIELEALLRKELKRKAWQELKDIANELQSDPNRLSYEEIQEELAAYKQGK
jgi:uncharacterized protein YaaR (DUF327 family)